MSGFYFFLIPFYKTMCPIKWTLRLYYRKSFEFFQYPDAISFRPQRKSNDFVHLKRKMRPRQPFWLPRAFVLHVFVACDDTAFEVHFDAVIVYDDLFYQLLHNHTVIRIHDVAALDMFCEAVQPHLELTVSVLGGL